MNELDVPPTSGKYAVRSGDTLWKLSGRFYGDGRRYRVIAVINGLSDPDLIVGEWLLIPDLTNVGHHTVAPGETLQVLADRWYGDWSLWIVIAIANQLSGDNPEPGSVLIQPRLNRRHTVVVGDTIWKLASQNYGDYGDVRTQTAVEMVAAANLIDDPNHISLGQVVDFPSIDLAS